MLPLSPTLSVLKHKLQYSINFDMNSFPRFLDNSMSAAQAISSVPPSPAMQDGDRSTSFHKTTSHRSILSDPYFNMHFTTPEKKRRRNDASPYFDEGTNTFSTVFSNTPSHLKQPDLFDGLCLRLKARRSGGNIFADIETSYIVSQDGPNVEDIMVQEDFTTTGSSSQDVDANCCTNCSIEENRVNHLLVTPRNQSTCDSSPCPPRSIRRGMRESPSHFHVVSPSQPDLPFLPF